MPNSETLPATAEALTAPAEITVPTQSTPQTPPPPTPTIAQPLPASQVPVTPPATPTVASQSPQIADDVDVIEKEWVDAAEQIVKDTRDDPFRQEEAVENLQIDYLKKRYGKDVKRAEEN